MDIVGDCSDVCGFVKKWYNLNPGQFHLSLHRFAVGNRKLGTALETIYLQSQMIEAPIMASVRLVEGR